MASLSTDLLAVIQALPSPNLQMVGADYRVAIRRNATTLDEVGSGLDGLSARERAEKACKVCEILFGDSIVTPEQPLYRESQQKNWSMTCWLPAAGILKIQNAVEVALALKIVTHTQCTFAVRSGGHNASPGFSGVGEAGILLDLGALNSITLSTDEAIASVGTGATWEMVYQEMEKHERTVVGGRVAGVGVGGLILGGGMSHFSNHWGLVCDNVKNFEVVLASSEIVQANAKENADLFRALKGGGANFGVVTRFDLYTDQEYDVWYTVKVYSANDVSEIMKASVEIQTAMDDDDRIGFFLSVYADTLIAGLLYRGEAPALSVFQALDKITPIMTAVPEMKGTQLSAAHTLVTPGQAKRLVGTATVRPDPDLYVKLHGVLQDIVRDNASPYSLAFTFQPIGPAAVKQGQYKGTNVMNVSPENQSWLGIMAQWTDEVTDDLPWSHITQLISSIEATSKAHGLYMDFHFMNDASFSQSPLKGYGPENLAFLWEVSRKWDPHGVFQRLQNSGFLLSKTEGS